VKELLQFIYILSEIVLKIASFFIKLTAQHDIWHVFQCFYVNVSFPGMLHYSIWRLLGIFVSAYRSIWFLSVMCLIVVLF